MSKKKKSKKTFKFLSNKQYDELKQAEKSLLNIKDMLLKAKEIFDGYQITKTESIIKGIDGK